MQKHLLKLLGRNKYSALLILVGTFVWSLTMIKSGLLYDYGIGFWGPNGHDGVWHISLAKGLTSGSLELPIFAGENIKNYHIGFDLILAFINKLFGISLFTLYFQIIPPVLALLIGILTYVLVYRWKKNEREAFWAVFFVYFSGGLGWIVTLLRDKTLGGESIFWSQQSISTLINPPFAFSLVLLLLGLVLLNHKKITFPVTVFGVLLSIKAYAGVLILGALFITGLVFYIKYKEKRYINIFLGTFVISLIIFLPLNYGASSLIEFTPFWFLETMMEFPDRLGWQKFAEAMVNYKNGGMIVKMIITYTFAFFVFVLGNFGMRIISIFEFMKDFTRNKLNEVNLIILLITVGGLLASLLFVQKGTAWNTIQFLYYSLFFSAMVAGIYFSKILDNLNKYSSLLIALALLLMIPTTIGTLRDYLPSRPPAKISIKELEALDFLNFSLKGTILVMPFDRKKAQEAMNNPPRPLYLYESTAYVSATTGKRVFIEDEVNLEILGYKWKERRENVEALLKENNSKLFRDFVTKNNIKYIYVPKALAPNLKIFEGGEKIFENAEILVFSY